MLEVSGIYKKFKKRQILNGASFTAAPGQCVGIAGGNGCGKTTLLSILAGVSRPELIKASFLSIPLRRGRGCGKAFCL